MRTLPQQVLSNKGQATVEAAFLIPVLFILILVMVQPVILLYDRMVMSNAALEGCRILATLSEDMDSEVDAFIRRRLSSVPQQDYFHVHEPECTWQISCQGSEATTTVQVDISTEVKPLPIIGYTGYLLGAANDQGNFVISVHKQLQTQPDWVGQSEEGLHPSRWTGEH